VPPPSHQRVGAPAWERNSLIYGDVFAKMRTLVGSSPSLVDARKDRRAGSRPVGRV
jgi:hypothetical protein